MMLDDDDDDDDLYVMVSKPSALPSTYVPSKLA
jgi:hypothetical protein